MIEVELNEHSQYQDHLSWIDTFTEPDIIALHVDIPTFQVQDYQVILYEYDRHDKPAKRWKHNGKWKRGYTVSFDMINSYACKVGVRYLVTFVFYIQNIEVRYHAFIKLR